jgi:hypothetical protein
VQPETHSRLAASHAPLPLYPSMHGIESTPSELEQSSPFVAKADGSHTAGTHSSYVPLSKLMSFS